jgi:hypothetical protein
MSKTTMRRRRFVHLMVLGAGAAAASGASLGRAKAAEDSAAPARTRKRGDVEDTAAKPVTPAMRREIESQKKTLSTSLRAIREYTLPAGSDPAFLFRPRVASPSKTSRDGRSSERRREER